MKMRNSSGKKRASRDMAHRASSRHAAVNVPRLYLFMEVFVDKDIPDRSTK
jgi:hypothetical protein